MFKSYMKNSYRAKRHFDSLHSDKVFTCGMCGIEKKRKDKLKDHFVTKHSISKDYAKMLAEKA